MSGAPPDVDVDELYRVALEDLRPCSLDSAPSDGAARVLSPWVQKQVDDAYEAGRTDVLHQGAARAALLDAQSRWLAEADTAPSLTQRTLARVVAEVLGQEADRLRATPKPTLTDPLPAGWVLGDDGTRWPVTCTCGGRVGESCPKCNPAPLLAAGVVLPEER